MKNPTKAVLFPVFGAIIILLSAAHFVPLRAQAQVKPAVEEYRLVGIGQYPDEQIPAHEKKLNQLGADGWRVRVAAGNVVILAR
jgi:hypothetical protein